MSHKLNNTIWMKGLTLECPHRHAARNCPMTQLRGKNAVEANQEIDQMDEHEVTEALIQHRACYDRRKEHWGDPVI